MNHKQTLARFIVRTAYKGYNNGFPPCNMDICMCMINLNIKDSYNDRIHYNNCYNRNNLNTKVFVDHIHKTFVCSSDEVI